MKLATYSPASGGTARPGIVLDDGRIVDIPAHVAAVPGVDFTTMLGIIRGARRPARHSTPWRPGLRRTPWP